MTFGAYNVTVRHADSGSLVLQTTQLNQIQYRAIELLTVNNKVFGMIQSTSGQHFKLF